MIIDLPSKLTSEEFKKVVREAAKPFWFVKRERKKKFMGFDKNGKITIEKIFTDNYSVYFKPFPLIFTCTRLNSVLDRYSISLVEGTAFPFRRLSERIYRSLKKIN